MITVSLFRERKIFKKMCNDMFVDKLLISTCANIYLMKW